MDELYSIMFNAMWKTGYEAKSMDFMARVFSSKMRALFSSPYNKVVSRETGEMLTVWELIHKGDYSVNWYYKKFSKLPADPIFCLNFYSKYLLNQNIQLPDAVEIDFHEMQEIKKFI
ncbi:MAG TPA: hypothetical protein PLG30_14205 [Bacteroidia bacterium]|nr:hypothetical protein [Bacteroidia bacterium]